MHNFRPGMLVEVIYTQPDLRHYLGERFVLTKKATGDWAHCWETPWNEGPVPVYAEENSIKPVDDGSDYKRFMERVMKPVDLGQPVMA